MRYILFLWLLAPVLAAYSQGPVTYGLTITQEDLRKHLEVLASDALMGRETGEAGQKMAAAYLRAQFENLGLEGPVMADEGAGYYQVFPLYRRVAKENWIRIGDRKYDNYDRIIYIGDRTMEREEEIEVVFGGSGTEQELEWADVEGRGVAIITQDLMNGIQPVTTRAMEMGATMVFVIPNMEESAWETMARRFRQVGEGGRLRLERPETSGDAGLFALHRSVAEALFDEKFEDLEEAMADAQAGKRRGIRKVSKGRAVFSTEQKIEQVNSENVLGFLKGTDKKEEVLVITAHYDHVGVNNGEVYNGADDDGSGTVTVLEVAEAFVRARAEGNGPRRSILFMPVAGEEMGLLGSDYYTRNPVFPLEETVANLNIDMIGRIDPVHRDSGDYVYLVGSDKLSTELHELSEEVNATYTGMELDYTYNDEDHPDRIYYRSDHWNFAKNDIPIIFYFNGIHEDYHRPTDTVDKIAFGLLEKRARLVFYTAWEIANREERLKLDQRGDE